MPEQQVTFLQRPQAAARVAYVRHGQQVWAAQVRWVQQHPSDASLYRVGTETGDILIGRFQPPPPPLAARPAAVAAPAKQERHEDPTAGTEPCPYCGHTFAKPPQRKTRCRACGNDVYVRARQALLPGRLFTAQDADAIDGFAMAEPYGATRADFTAAQQRLAAAGGRPDPLSAVLALLDAMPPRILDLHLRHCFYYAVALFLDRRGRDPLAALRASAQCELAYYRTQGVTKVVVECGPNACAPCRRLSKRPMTLEAALVQLPVPCAECRSYEGTDKRGFCKCMYEAVD